MQLLFMTYNYNANIVNTQSTTGYTAIWVVHIRFMIQCRPKLECRNSMQSTLSGSGDDRRDDTVLHAALNDRSLEALEAAIAKINLAIG